MQWIVPKTHIELIKGPRNKKSQRFCLGNNVIWEFAGGTLIKPKPILIVRKCGH